MSNHEFAYFPFAGGRGEAIRCVSLRGVAQRHSSVILLRRAVHEENGVGPPLRGGAGAARVAGHRVGTPRCPKPNLIQCNEPRRIAIHASKIECKHTDLTFADYQKQKGDTKDNAWLNGTRY